MTGEEIIRMDLLIEENARLKKAVDEAEEIIERMLEGEGLDRRDYHNGREWLKEFGTKE